MADAAEYVVAEFRAAYLALRKADRGLADLLVPFVPVIERADLQAERGNDLRVSRRALPGVSVEFARLRAAYEMLPAYLRARAHLLLTVERAA